MLAKGAKISRSNLLTGESSCNRWQFEDDSKHRRQSPVTPEDLIVENQVLQLAAFDRHQHSFMRRVDRSDDTTGTRLHGQGSNATTSGTNPAAETKVLVDNGLLAT